MRYIKFYLIILLLLLAKVSNAEDIYVSSKILSSSLSQQAAMAALSACTKLGYQVGVAVVDRNGNLTAFVRDPLAGPHTIELSDKKAFTSASTRVPTAALNNQRTLNFSNRLITVKGGLPISIAGYIYGGIGVSGATSEDDEKCAQAGIDAISEEIEFSQ